MLAVLGLAIPTLVVWFMAAPDPRFALAPLWLVPVALVGWAAPARVDNLSRRPSPRTLIAAGAVCIALAVALTVTLDTTSILAPLLVLLVGLAIWAANRLPRQALSQRLPGSLLATLTVTSIVLAFMGVVAHMDGFKLVSTNGGGPLGTEPVPGITFDRVVTKSGLRLAIPAYGTDRCFRLPLCTPEPDARLRLLGSSVSDGFTKRP